MPIAIVEKDFEYTDKRTNETSTVKIKVNYLNHFEINNLRKQGVKITMMGNTPKIEADPLKEKELLMRKCYAEGPFKLEELNDEEGIRLYAIMSEVNHLPKKKNTPSAGSAEKRTPEPVTESSTNT